MSSIPNRLNSFDAKMIALLVLLPFTFYIQMTLGARVLTEGDITQFFFPSGIELANALKEMRLPLWTPGLQGGFPLLAESQIGALYPPNWILYRGLPVPFAISYTILFHLAWASGGMYMFARARGLDAPSAFLGGAAIGMSGFFTAHLQHLTLSIVAAYLPWLFFCFERAWQSEAPRAQIRWSATLALAVALQFLGGFPQIAILNLAALALYGLFKIARAESHARFARGVMLIVLPVAGGALIAAAQLLPTLELLGYSVRGADPGPEFFSSFSLDPRALSQFVVPFGWLDFPDVLDVEFWGYVGLIPFLLAFVALAWRRAPHSLFFALLALVALALALGGNNPLYSALYAVPIFNRFRVPARFLLWFVFAASFLAAAGLHELRARLRDQPRARADAALVAGFAALAFAPMAMQHSLSPEFWADAWKILPWLFAVSGGALIALAARRALSRQRFTAILVGITLIDLFAFGGAFRATFNATAAPAELFQPPRPLLAMARDAAPYRMFTNIFNVSLRPNRPAAFGISSAQIYSPLALARNEEYLAEMTLAMFNLMNIRYVTQFADKPAWQIPALDLFADDALISATRATGIEIVSYADNVSAFAEGVVAAELILTTADGTRVSAPLRLGVETADWAYAGIAATRAVAHSQPAARAAFPAYLLSLRREFDGYKYTARINFSQPFQITSARAESRLRGEAKIHIERVDLLDESGKKISLASLAGRNDFALVFRSHAVAVMENLSVLPRAFVVHRAERVNDAQILARLQADDFDPAQTALLADADPAPLAAPAATTASTARIVEYKPERVVIAVEASVPGYLILADSWYPGWIASVDGAPAPVERADFIFRAVRVNAGAQTVVFEYRSASFYAGAAISAVAACVLLWIVWRSRAR